MKAGLKICTKRLNIEVAARVAPTLMTLVVAAAESISAFGTGISRLVPGRVIVVTSTGDVGSKEGEGKTSFGSCGLGCCWSACCIRPLIDSGVSFGSSFVGSGSFFALGRRVSGSPAVATGGM